jgi:hypothetical protein
VKALDGGTWGLGEEFDRLSERLFELAEEKGVLLSVRVRKHAARGAVVEDENGRIVGRLRVAAKKRKKR